MKFASQEAIPHRRSFRRALRKAFVKKVHSPVTIKGANLTPHQPVKCVAYCSILDLPLHLEMRYYSERAEAFSAKISTEVAEWFGSIGLDMYSDLVQEKMLSGEKLAEIASEDNSHQLVVRDEMMLCALWSQLTTCARFLCCYVC